MLIRIPISRFKVNDRQIGIRNFYTCISVMNFVEPAQYPVWRMCILRHKSSKSSGNIQSAYRQKGIMFICNETSLLHSLGTTPALIPIILRWIIFSLTLFY